MLRQNNISWNYLSIYYNRKEWSRLVYEILDFEHKISSLSLRYLVSFSEEKGEHIRLAISSLQENHKIIRHLSNAIFSNYLQYKPSLESKQYIGGSFFWMSYENNTLVWDRFKHIGSSTWEREFSETTFKLIITLTDEDFSLNNFLNIILYLLVKLIKKIHETYTINNRNMIDLPFINIDYKNDQELKNLVNEKEVFELLDSHYIDSEKSSTLEKWLSYTQYFDQNILLSFSSMEESLTSQLGINSLHKKWVLAVVKEWYTKKWFPQQVG
ncbi:hypothetical protein [Sphingobacterium sp. GVS05A]|uniref:hypothetical protein n=1 Tax=Sphingobacterium TaxID=28453 RepID=UPI001CC0DBFD|nr:hypothetical protein [Sphingobacterium sp. GVS05A]